MVKPFHHLPVQAEVMQTLRDLPRLVVNSVDLVFVSLVKITESIAQNISIDANVPKKSLPFLP